MISLKKPEEIQIMAEGGQLLASILKKMEMATIVGITTQEIDNLARQLIAECGGKPSF